MLGSIIANPPLTWNDRTMPSDDAESRREFLGGIFTSAGKVVTRRFTKTGEALPEIGPAADSFLTLMQSPDSVRVFFEDGMERLDPMRGGIWSGDRATVKNYLYSDRLRLSLECPEGEPTHIAVRWTGQIVGVRRYLCLGERSEWRAEDPDRVMPWYFLAYDGKRTHGYGVAVKANAFCSWSADRSGITLWIEVRNGNRGVLLGERELELCEVVCREGDPEESAFDSHREFCRQMSPRPRLAGHPVYGLTDRYRKPEDQTLEAFLESAKVISELSPNETNRPFCLLESPHTEARQDEALATQLKGIGARAGATVWPLMALDATPDTWRLASNPSLLDPTNPEASEQIGERAAQLVESGFELIRCNFPPLDFDAETPWTFQSRSRTNAEVLTHLYQRLRLAAGSAILYGNGAPSHLAAGVFEIANPLLEPPFRDWESAIRQQVNAISFLGAHQGNFYALDLSIAEVHGSAHDRVMADWIRMLGESGTTLFSSVDPAGLGVEEWTLLRDAYGFAALEWPVAEPLDWMNSVCPRKWRLREEKVEFDWSTLDGPNPITP